MPILNNTPVRLALLFCLVVPVHAEEAEVPAQPPPPDICRSRDAAGNLVFSDQCGDRKTEVELREATVFAPPEQRRRTQQFREQAFTPPFVPYRRLAITSPESGENLRDNAGNVSISVRLEPRLKQGHRLQVVMDGKPVGNASGGAVRLENVDRGEHVLRARIIDGAGEPLQESEPTTFMLHRASKLHRRAGG